MIAAEVLAHQAAATRQEKEENRKGVNRSRKKVRTDRGSEGDRERAAEVERSFRCAGGTSI